MTKQPAVLLSDLSVVELVRRMVVDDAEEGAAVLGRLIAEEDQLVLDNLMKPYFDKVARVLLAVPRPQVQPILDRLPSATLKRALFGNFTRIADADVTALLVAMTPERAARLIDVMSVGIDAPGEMARVVGTGVATGAGAAADAGAGAYTGAVADAVVAARDGNGAGHGIGPAVALAHPAAILRLLYELDDAEGAALLRAAGAAQTGAVAALLDEDGNAVHRKWARELRDAATPASATATRSASALRALRPQLDDLPVVEAAHLLAAMPSRQATRAVRMMGAGRSAKVLAGLAGEQPGLAAGLLEAANTSVLLRPPQPGVAPVWWLHECPAAGVLEAMDPTDPATTALVQAMGRAQLELILDHVSAPARAWLDALAGVEPGRHLRFGVEIMGVARGRRRTTRLDGGLGWVRIEETLDTGRTPKPVVIDVLELPLDRVRLSARMAVADDKSLPAAQAAEVFERYRRAGERPTTEAFAGAGLTQLSRAVRASGALAAINGNFYFDYGHYLNGVTLGIDIAHVPGLFFGDPIGWFVAQGKELIPPAFNRAAALVTDDGALHIERVFMTDVTLADGHRLGWDALNVPKSPGRTIAYTSLFGYRTELRSSHVDIAIARGRIWAVNDQGSQVIPLTGFVLSVPVEAARELLGCLQVGDPVTVGNDFPTSRGRVVEAMACGPSLVRSGSLDLDFVEEDFGQQDSTVMSFFLPRTVETYDAARSFLAVRDGTLILGTVSGTAYGFGRSGASAGLTFGEMAQLCVDLGVEHAYALDGGGSSSLVARHDGGVRVLNRPTGGADVGEGEERFINTYWLVFER